MKDIKIFFDLDFLKKLIVISPAYLSLISFLYLYVYYYLFDIRIFNYLTINSFLLQSINVLGKIIFVYMIILMLMLVLKDIFVKKIEETKKRVEGEPSIEQSKPKDYPLFIAMLFVVIIFVFDLYRVGINKLVIPLFLHLILIFTVYYLMKKFITQDYISEFFPNFIVVSLIIVLPYFTIIDSYHTSLKIKHDAVYSYVKSESLENYQREKNLKLVGKVDQYYFLQPVGNDSVIMVRKYDDFSDLNIHHYP